MSRRAIIMAMMKGVSEGGQVLTTLILHPGDGGNKPLYSFMNGYYVMLGLTHTAGFFSESDLGRMTGVLDLTLTNTVHNFSSKYEGHTYNVLSYLKKCTGVDAHGCSSIDEGVVNCVGMDACKEIRFDGTDATNIVVTDLANLQSIRYSENATEITFDGNTNLGINIV